MDKLRILITGINGFIGHNIANMLCESGYEVWGTYRQNIKYCNNEVHYIKCDLSVPMECDIKFDAVIHLAGQVEDAETFSYIKNSVITTKNIIEYCEDKKIETLLFMSSIAIYGETNVEVDENSSSINATTYGMTKIISERLVNESKIRNRIILRLPRVLGNGIDVSYQWLPALSYNLLNNNDIRYFNSELDYNNLMDVKDLAVFCDHLIKNYDNINETFVLGTVEKMKILDIIMFLKERLNSSSKLIKMPDKKTTVFSINVKKALSFGYQPKSICTILNDYADYIKGNFSV